MATVSAALLSTGLVDTAYGFPAYYGAVSVVTDSWDLCGSYSYNLFGVVPPQGADPPENILGVGKIYGIDSVIWGGFQPARTEAEITAPSETFTVMDTAALITN